MQVFSHKPKIVVVLYSRIRRQKK